jgi:hypothetical protein
MLIIVAKEFIPFNQGKRKTKESRMVLKTKTHIPENGGDN